MSVWRNISLHNRKFWAVFLKITNRCQMVGCVNVFNKTLKKNIFIIQVSLIWVSVSDYQMCVCNLVWFCLCIPTFLQGRILCFNCICIRPRSLCICNCTLWPRRKKADRRILLRVRTRRASVIHQPNHLSQTISAKLSQPSQINHFNHLSQTVSFPQLGNQCDSIFLAGS